uniref:Uncharacterized protein n=1 Tax=Dulem virus 38 TaxID=3145756 RepID=A0AAU8B1J1_9CAUD
MSNTTWNRIWQHPTARIQPLDAKTIHEANVCHVWEDGVKHPTALAKRCGQRCWGIYPRGATAPAAMGASALEAATQWLTLRERTEAAA